MNSRGKFFQPILVLVLLGVMLALLWGIYRMAWSPRETPKAGPSTIEKFQSDAFWNSAPAEEVVRLVKALPPERRASLKDALMSAVLSWQRCDLLDDFVALGILDAEWRKKAVGWSLYHCKPACVKGLLERGFPLPDDALALVLERCYTEELLQKMVSSGVDVNAPDPKGRVPLLIAMAKTPVEIRAVELLLRSGADPNLAIKGNPSPFIFACASPAIGVDLLELMFKSGASLRDCSAGFCPVSACVMSGRVDKVRWIVDKGGLEYRWIPKDVGEDVLLFRLISRYGSTDILEVILSGLSADRRRRLFRDIRFWEYLLSPENRHVREDIKVLRERFKINPNLVLPFKVRGRDVGITLLGLATASGAVEAVKALISIGAYPKAGPNYTQPVAIAVSTHNAEILRILFSAGANPFYVREADGYNLYSLALASRGRKSDLMAVLELLAEKKVGVNHKDVFGKTPLMVAIQGGWDREVIDWLIKAGADATERDYRGFSVLEYGFMFAVEPEIVDLLVSAGAGKGHRNPLSRARASYEEMLLKNKALNEAWIGHCKAWKEKGLDVDCERLASVLEKKEGDHGRSGEPVSKGSGDDPGVSTERDH